MTKRKRLCILSLGKGDAMALLKAEMIDTMEQNLDDPLYDRELDAGVTPDPQLTAMARAMFPGHTEREYLRAAMSVDPRLSSQALARGPLRLGAVR